MNTALIESWINSKMHGNHYVESVIALVFDRHSLDLSIKLDRIDMLMDMAVNWQYEMRRDMQEIIPGLWLGPYSCARDNSLLHLKGITHILCVRESNEEMMVRMRFPEEFHYLCM